MADTYDFNVGKDVKAQRKLLKTYVDISDTGTPEWFLVGSGVEESTIELNPNVETVTDVLGITTTNVTKWEASQSFSPFTIKGGSKLAFKLHKIWMDKKPELLSKFNVLICYNYVGNDSDGYDAEMQKNCTINITSIGGSAYVDMPISITYSNDTEVGTVKFTDNAPTFTPNSAA